MRRAIIMLAETEEEEIPSGNKEFAMNIRAVKIEDAVDINHMRTMDGVRENILGIASERISDAEAFIRGLSQNDHVLVAEENCAVIGCAGLHVSSRPRERHTAWCGINVRTEHQRQGVGKRSWRLFWISRTTGSN
jgi:putative acetyltransferase